MNHYDTKFLNIMKLVMAFFVMVVHFSPFKTINPLLHFISIHGFTRVAVPFFILSTGYLISEAGKISKSRRKKTLKKMISLYLFWTALYSPFILLQLMYTPQNAPWWNIFLRNLFFEGSFIHLWYLLATIIGIIIITTLTTWFKAPMIIGITVFLYILGVLGDSYYGWSMTLPLLSSFKIFLFQFINTTRNGLFFAPVFLYTGMLIKQYQPRFKIKTLTIMSLILLTLSFIEVLLLRNTGWAKDYNLTLSILPLSIITFLFSLHIKVSFNTERYKEMAATLFYVHIGVYILVQAILNSGNINQFRNYGLLDFILTIILSFLLTHLIHYFRRYEFIRHYFM